MPVKVGDDLADIVSAAIMEQAAKDYRCLRGGEKISGESIESMLEFFHSEWCQILCGDVDPMYILEKLDAEPIVAGERENSTIQMRMLKRVEQMRNETAKNEKEQILKNIAINLTELRMKRGLHRNSVAKSVGVSEAALLGYETAKSVMGALNLKKIADFYGVTTDSLYEGDDGL